MKFFSKIIKSKLMTNIVMVITIVGMISGFNIIFNKPMDVKALENENTGMLRVNEVSAGFDHTMTVRSDGTVWGSGYNGYGQLGIGNTTNQISQVKVPIDNVKEVICGSNHTMFLKNDGTVWGSGLNNSGQLGLGNTTNQLTPVQIPIENIKEIKCRYYHTMFLKNDGTVWGTGNNDYGELGIGNTETQLTPVKIPIDNIKEIECGYYHGMFIKNDGTVWGSGLNNSGQLGLGNTTNQHTPVKIPIENVKDISVGSNHTMFLKNDGTVWGTGDNNYGQLGLGNNTYQLNPVKASIDNVKSVQCSSIRTMFIKNDGTVLGTGYNYYGELGIGNTANQLTPTKVNIDNVKNIVVGANHTIFIKNNCNIGVCGNNNYGQLGIGNTSPSYVPIEVRSYWLYNAWHILNKGYNNLSKISEYGSLASIIYAKSNYDDSRPLSYINDSSIILGTVPMEDPEIRIKEVLPNGSAITVDNYGSVQYYQNLASNPINIAVDGTTIKSLEYGMVNKSPSIIFYMKDGTTWFFDPAGTALSLKMLPINENEFTKTSFYKDKCAKASFFLFQKTNGDLVYFNSNRTEVATGININNVLKVIPNTLNNSTIYLMKDGTLKCLNATSGLASNITLSSGLTVQDVLSNRFIKMSDGFIYAINNNAIVATNILESATKTAVNNIIWMQSGSIQILNTNGTMTTLSNVNGKLIKSIDALDNNNAYIVNQDNSTYGIGNLITTTDLKDKNIDYSNIAAFISNNDASTNGKLLIMKDGSVYINPSNWTRSAQIAFDGIVLDELQGEREALQNATNAVSKAEISKSQKDVDAARVLVNALDDDVNKSNLLNRLNIVQVYINNQPQTPTSNRININQVDKNSVTISWQDSNPKQTKYQIRVGAKYVTASGALTVIPTWLTFTEKKITITGLDPNTSYDINIKGRNQAGISCYQSETAIVTTSTL